jgi:outer membrane lipoprotein SlyB
MRCKPAAAAGRSQEDTFMQRFARIAIPIVCAALLGACASNSAVRNAPVYGGSPSSGSSTPSAAVAYGQVRSIEALGIAKDQPQGAGAVVGGVLGAVIGRQMADSSAGKNAGTVVGAVGGAILGNEIEKSSRRDHSGVRIVVTLDNGGTRNFDFKESGSLRVGDRVRIEGTQLVRI